MNRILSLIVIGLIFRATSAFAQCKENEKLKTTEDPFKISSCSPVESTYEESYIELVIPASAPLLNEMKIMDNTRGAGRITISGFAGYPKPRTKESRIKLTLPGEFSHVESPVTDTIELSIAVSGFGKTSRIDGIKIRLKPGLEPDEKKLVKSVLDLYGSRINKPFRGLTISSAKFVDSNFEKPYMRTVRVEVITKAKKKKGKKSIETTHWSWNKNKKQWFYESMQ